MKNRSELREVAMKVLYQIDILKDAKEEYDIEALVKEQLEVKNDFVNELSLKPKTDEPNNVVKLMTIHQAKGLESKVVFIVDARDEMMPGKKKGINLEEERRVFYVAITRAKEELYLVTTEKNGPNDAHRCVASRFISEIYK